MNVLITSSSCERCLKFETDRFPNTTLCVIDGLKSLGFGDFLKTLFFMLGFEYCDKCALRRAWINRLFPSNYAKTLTPFVRGALFIAQKKKLDYPILVSVKDGEIENVETVQIA